MRRLDICDIANYTVSDVSSVAQAALFPPDIFHLP